MGLVEWKFLMRRKYGMLDYEVLLFGFCTLVRDNLSPTENRWFSAPSGMRLFSMTVVVLNEAIVTLCEKELFFFF